MDDVLELSSESDNTIIFPPNDENFNSDVDIEDVVKKYISENCLQEEEHNTIVENITQPTYTQDFKDEDLVDVPLTKRLKKSYTDFHKKENFESSSQDDGTSEIAALRALSEKYKQSSENNFYNYASTGSVLPVDGQVPEKCSVSDPLELNDKERKKREKEIQKQQKIEERERKKNQLQTEKALKQALSAANKNLKPEECMKFITVHIDNEIINAEYGKDIITALQTADVQYKVNSQIFPNTVSWTRTIQSHSLADDGKLALSTQHEDTDEILLIMNCKDFVEHVNNKTLSAYVQSLKSILDNKKISISIFGLENYLRYQKNKKKNELRSQISDDTQRQTKDDKTFKEFPQISRRSIEFALTELQLLCACSHRLIELAPDLGLMVAQFTKAIAQLPFKLQKQGKEQQTEWFALGENKDCVKVDKNGNGLQRLWKQTLTTFPLARLETAEAISTKYPTPSSLMEAYESCNITGEAELLLQDITIRRAAGPLTSMRRIGPEFSKKVFNFFTSADGDALV